MRIEPGSGVVFTNNSLVLQNINIESRGNYTCKAINSEGIGTSEVISIDVKCKQIY